MTMHAIIGDFRIKEVYLGRKTHKPSYGKMVPMFKQASSTVFFILNDYYKSNSKVKSSFDAEDEEYRKGIDDFIRKPNMEEIQNNIELSIKLLNQFINEESNPLKDLHKDVLNTFNEEKKVTTNDWVKVLSETVNIIKFCKDESERYFLKLGEYFLPFYLLRVATYFEEANCLSHIQVDEIIENEVKLLKDIV